MVVFGIVFKKFKLRHKENIKSFPLLMLKTTTK